MKTTGINRVAIIVKDFDKAIALYSELLNTTFYPLDTAEESGLRVAFSYDPGIEMISPIPGSTEPRALALAQRLKEHGEGLLAAVFFAVDDVEQAHVKAEEMGIRVLQKHEVDPEEAKKRFHGRYSMFVEYVFNSEDTHGATVGLGQF